MNATRERPQTWLVDVGNTRVKWARADRLAHGAIARPHAGGAYEAAFAELAGEVASGDVAWIASVATAAVTAGVADALARRDARIERASTRPALAGVRIAYADPSRLGVDRFLAMLAARARGPATWLVASVGTATTIDLLAADGHHVGGLIAPSPTLMRKALSQRAPHLPVEGGRIVAFATDTTDALASGTIGSARALIVASLDAAQARLGERPRLLLAGGGARALCEGWDQPLEHAPDLVLEGLAVVAQAAACASGR